MFPVETLNYLLALGAVASQIAAVVLIFAYIGRNRFGMARSAANFLGSYGLWLSFAFVLLGVGSSLFYSEILGFLPCGLCWFQRIFLYPQVVLYALALLKRERRIAEYGMVLSILGGIVSLYHHYIQMGGNELLPCPAVAGAADCAKRFVFEFGYVTFPLVAFSVFALVAVMLLFVRAAEKEGGMAERV
jgi:disulfide bond formation protein DsbB